MITFLIAWAFFTFCAALVVFPDGAEEALDPSLHVPASFGMPISVAAGLVIAAGFLYR